MLIFHLFFVDVPLKHGAPVNDTPESSSNKTKLGKSTTLGVRQQSFFHRIEIDIKDAFCGDKKGWNFKVKTLQRII